MTMKNSFSQNTASVTPVIGNVTGSTMPQANAAVDPASTSTSTSTSVPVPAPTPYEIDVIQLFEKSYSLCISLGNLWFSSNNFWIEVEETDVYQSVIIKTGKGVVVFAARRMIAPTSPSLKLKVTCLRKGKWAEYFMETFYPQIIAKNFENYNDSDVDYVATEAIEFSEEIEVKMQSADSTPE